MKAQVLHQPGPIEEKPLRLEDVPIPHPGKGQVRLKVVACGVCHTDLHTVEGDIELPRQPIVPGHQVVGVVETLGEGATRFKVGQRIGAIWLYRTCGECRYCLTDRENLCSLASFTGLHDNGGYAEYMVVDEEFAYALPMELPDTQIAPLLCGGVIGYRALKLARFKSGEKIGLYGFGNSAHIAIQIARHAGCPALVFTRSRKHQEHAQKLGAAWVGRAEDDPPTTIDAGVIFAPAGELVPHALRVLNPGGTLVLAGIHMTDIPGLPYEMLYEERTLRTVANSTRRDVEELLQLAERIPIHTDVEIFPLREANEVLLGLKKSKFNGDAVLVP